MSNNHGADRARRNRSRRAGVTAAAVVAAALLVASCSSDSDGGAAPSTTTTKATGAATTTTKVTGVSAAPAGIEAFSGTVDEFYEVPEEKLEGEPGSIIRTMPVEAPEGERGMRVMYRSTDADDDPRAVTGLIYTPDEASPEGGWPIVAWAHGTSGLASQCAPSRNPAPPPGYGVKGVRIATDYIGLGPVGEVHPYLMAAAEGHAVIDGVVAARSLPAVHAGHEWVVAGVSQGGHAALVTNEQAAERLPDAELLGAVALAPGAELGGTYGDEIQARVITTMVLMGLAAEDASVDPADYLNPEALAASKVITEGCIGDIIGTMAAPASDPGYFTTDPRTAPAGKAWLEANDPGQVKSDSPLLVVQGEADALVVPARTAALFKRLCGLGQVVEQINIPEATHDTVTDLSVDQVSDWVQARFAGEEATDGC